MAVIVVAHFLLQAVFVPAYEGPDEPFHLARIVAFADRPLPVAFVGEKIDGAVLAGVQARPTTPGLHSTLPGPSFGEHPASFNLLHPIPKLPPVRQEPNPENNQPPLFYFLVGMFFRLTRVAAGGALSSPELRLLGTRLLCVAMLAFALALPLRRIALRRPPLLAIAGLILLLLPGASEALVRCANEAPVFLWSSVAIYLLERRASTPAMASALATGPLLKLTALPVVAFVVVALWMEGRKRAAILGALCAAAVFPIQLLRGFRWGGTLELNSPGRGIAEPVFTALSGLGRSIYVFVKTAFWLGGSGFFKAPGVLVVAYFGLIVACLLLIRSRRPPLRLVPHLAGGLLASIGFLTFAMANHRFFGVWGGVGGGYAWAWMPWLLVAANDLGSLSSRSQRFLLAATALFVVAANAVYYTMAFRLYG